MANERKALLIVVFSANVMLSLLFVYGNCSLWAVYGGHNVASTRLISSSWDPLNVVMLFHSYNSETGAFSTVESPFIYTNTPFILFWVSTIVNLILIMLLTKDKNSKK